MGLGGEGAGYGQDHKESQEFHEPYGLIACGSCRDYVKFLGSMQRNHWVCRISHGSVFGSLFGVHAMKDMVSRGL